MRPAHKDPLMGPVHQTGSWGLVMDRPATSIARREGSTGARVDVRSPATMGTLGQPRASTTLASDSRVDIVTSPSGHNERSPLPSA
jgi:hypothetical protein